jgi:anti-sigma factor RsiW
VKCDRAAASIAAYVDGELDVLRRRFVERHLHECAPCAEQHAELMTLRRRVRTEAPHFAAPPALVARVRAAVAAASAARPTRRERIRGRWPGRAGGALGGCAATVLALVVGTAIIDWRSGENIVTQAVARHVQATLGDRLVGVASSDQHTVKPWLSARLDYSPPVRDLADEGFPLLGGRVDTLRGHKVAALVYGYRKHAIDVFVAPGAFDLASSQTLRGFNVAHRRAAGWDWLAVSDAAPEVIDALLAEIVAASTAK